MLCNAEIMHSDWLKQSCDLQHQIRKFYLSILWLFYGNVCLWHLVLELIYKIEEHLFSLTWLDKQELTFFCIQIKSIKLETSCAVIFPPSAKMPLMRFDLSNKPWTTCRWSSRILQSSWSARNWNTSRTLAAKWACRAEPSELPNRPSRGEGWDMLHYKWPLLPDLARKFLVTNMGAKVAQIFWDF